MSTQPTTRREPPAETTTRPAFGTETTTDIASEAPSPFDAHDTAATFDAESTCRLPNTIDRENQYIG